MMCTAGDCGAASWPDDAPRSTRCHPWMAPRKSVCRNETLRLLREVQRSGDRRVHPLVELNLSRLEAIHVDRAAGDILQLLFGELGLGILAGIGGLLLVGHNEPL